MTTYRTCRGCILSGKPCETRQELAGRLKGLGITSVKWNCKVREARIKTGDPVWVETVAATDEFDDEGMPYRGEFPAYAIEDNGSKFTVFIDEGAEERHDEDLKFKPGNNRGFCNIPISRITARDADRQEICKSCSWPAYKGHHGGFVLAFGGTRTYHRLAVAIEDAGFEIRDMVQWLYGSGFPKSHDVSKGIDKAAGGGGWSAGVVDITEPATDAAKQWAGFGTALKPANEPICMARKPLEHGLTVAANVLKWGTGAINVDGCRVVYASDSDEHESKTKNQHSDHNNGARNNVVFGEDNKPRPNYSATGRFPANVITDGSDEVTSLLPVSGGTKARVGKRTGRATVVTDAGYRMAEQDEVAMGHDDAGGSVARYFYQAKANKTERAGSKHPTVKPIALMRYLCRLVTPPGGTILDPFAGSGTTGEAAILEGFFPIMIEREEEYQADIRSRMEALGARAVA
jgi:site-specific DNA-methyltransferase (adenine-specific)